MAKTIESCSDSQMISRSTSCTVCLSCSKHRSPEIPHFSFAASSATEEEEKLARWGRHPDGSTKVEVPKRVWRPQMKSTYVEPEFELDPSSSLDWIYEGRGKVLAKERNELPQRTDLIIFDKDKHGTELTNQGITIPRLPSHVATSDKCNCTNVLGRLLTGRTSKSNPRISILNRHRLT